MSFKVLLLFYINKYIFMYGCTPSLFSLSVHLSLVKRAEAGSEQRLSSALYRLVKLS